MKKTLLKFTLLTALAIPLFGCAATPEEAITNKDESTIIKDAKNVDDYLSKNDYNSIAYAYIYNIKEGLRSYESETTGTVKAKVLFFDYDISYHSITHKNGNAFYSKDHSTSTFANIENEFYQVDREKILVSRKKDKYDVYKAEDYKTLSYMSNQYLIMGYVFSDESILKSELISDKDGLVSIKYTLDNELATNWVKMDFKNNGDLSAYPDFKKINITLSMKKDFTPTSYRIEATYDASRAIIGTTEVKQESTCLFSSVNEAVTIPNESFLAEKLGAKPSELVTDDEEKSIRNDLGKAAMNLDLKGGVATEGTLTLTLSDALSMDLDIEANAFIDLERITKENVYGSLGLHANLEADEYFGSLISLVRGIAGDNLGPAADVLEDFKSLEVIYDNEGSFYLIPTNSEDKVKSVQKAKLTDLLDMVLKNVDVSTIIEALQSDGERDTFDFKKTPGANSANYTVEITLTEEAKASIKDTLNTFFENEDYAIIKTLISYKDFHDIKIVIEVKDDKLAGVDGAISYVKEGALGLSEEIADILELHLDIKEEKYDFAERLEYAEELYGTYLDCEELKARLETLLDNPYVSNGYLIDLENAYAEYLTLSEQERYFVGDNIPGRVETVKKNVADVIDFIKVYDAYDLNELDNDDILALAKAYYANRLDGNLLKAEIGEEDSSIINSLGDHVDYTIFDSALPKLTGDDEDAWGLDEEEIRGIKTILDIAQQISSVNGRILLSLLLNGNAMSVEDLSAKIDNLYNGLE